MRTPWLTLLPFTVIASALLLAAPAPAAPYAYTLVGQQEVSKQRGFAINLENRADATPQTVQTLRLVLGVADGQNWRYPSVTLPWQLDHDYRIKAVIGSTVARVWVDDKLALESAGNFVPSTAFKRLRSGSYAKTLLGTTDYVLQQTSLKVSAQGGQSVEVPFNRPEAWPKPLFLMEPRTPVSATWNAQMGQEVTVEASFLLLSADVQKWVPYVDKFGQASHGGWPRKIHSDADFTHSVADEKQRLTAWGTPRNYDDFGGYKVTGWSEKPTGFFRTVQRNGFWWLISPAGNPCFYLGVDDVTGTWENTQITGRETYFDALPPQKGAFAPAWNEQKGIWRFGFPLSNLICKYGDSWEQSAWQSARERIKTWGFSGAGKWSGIKPPVALVTTPVLKRTGVPTLGRIPDVFDPDVRAKFRAVLEASIGPEKDDPYVLGWSLGNEYDEVVLQQDIASILQMAATVPAKKALVEYALQTLYHDDAMALARAWKSALPTATGQNAIDQLSSVTDAKVPPDDVEQLRHYFANQYYAFIYKTVKEIDPNHLYLGFWLSYGWWQNESDWALIAAHCDVLGYDDYRATLDDEAFDRLVKTANKPILCGEMSFPSWYRGMRGYGIYGAAPADEAEAGTLYTHWLSDMARNPYVVGNCWFQYRDQPVTGRGPQTGTTLNEGEHFAFGLVDITDQPKWDLLEAMRNANLSVVGQRLQATQQSNP